MSKSPPSEAAKTPQEQLGKYRDAWSALSQLIGMGRSFSGHERNCCFLNNASGRFVDVSAATGLDLVDDGRAVALADWDGDGDLDMWLANRTAPRVRLMRNDSENGNHWVAIRLRGQSSNRDAIGARVRLKLDNSQTLIRTLHAGDGYLSQSSKWLHFGLGDASVVQEVTVAWPGGGREAITGFDAVDRRLLIVQGEGKARSWSSRGAAQQLMSAPIDVPKNENATRTWIMGRLPLPAASFRTNTGEERSLDEFRGQPLLVNLWSATCVSCVRELSQWTQQADRLQSAGLAVVALSVDEDQNACRQFIERLSFPFSSGSASAELIHAMELFQRTFLEKQTPLPVPSSFLLDRFGAVAAIYKGPLALDTLATDVEMLAKSREEQRAAAVPFAGRWASEVFPTDPRPLVQSIDLAGEPRNANMYLNRYIDYAQSAPRFTGDLSPAIVYKVLGERTLSQGNHAAARNAFAKVRELARGDAAMQKAIAELLLRQGLLPESREHFELALQANPQDATSLYNAGLAEMGLRQYANAVKRLRSALRIREDDADTHFHLANGLIAMGHTDQAISHLRRAVELNPESPYAANNLAWILATHPDDKLRNGKDAVALARKICESSHFSNPSTVATLAAALAEASQYEEAATMNQRAVALARQQNHSGLVEKLLKRQELFESNQAFRDNPGPDAK